MTNADKMKAALEKISKNSKHTENPELDPTCSEGNGDDQFQDGYTQAEYDVAVIAREALASLVVES